MVNSESMLGIPKGDSNVVTIYQVDKFTHTWLAENFVQSQIYLQFTGKVSTSAHFIWDCVVRILPL